MIFKKRKKLDEIIENDEPLARYIFSKSYFSENRIKRHAFMPYRTKVSVIRHKNCPQDCLLKIGKKIEKQRGHSLKAIGSVLTEDIRSIDSLDIEADTRGQHRRHANIKNFNYNDAKIRQIAQVLASKAKLLHII